MFSLIDKHRLELTQLCTKYRVRRLELFGSAVASALNPEASDLDFLVEFQALEANGYADAYFGLKEELENLFGMPVDLVMASAVKNPYFLRSIERNKQLLYAA